MQSRNASTECKLPFVVITLEQSRRPNYRIDFHFNEQVAETACARSCCAARRCSRNSLHYSSERRVVRRETAVALFIVFTVFTAAEDHAQRACGKRTVGVTAALLSAAVSWSMPHYSTSFIPAEVGHCRVDMSRRHRCTSTISGDLSDTLAAAIRCGDAAQVNAILEVLSPSPSDVRALVNRVLDDGSTPLNVAIAFRHFDVARTLLDCGSSVALPDSFRLDGCRRKPIHYACSAGCLELVKTFVEEFDVDVDEPDDGNATPIHHAAAAGHIGSIANVGTVLSVHPMAVVFVNMCTFSSSRDVVP